MKLFARSATRDCVVVFLVVGIACLSGILSSHFGFFTSMWSANAILVAMFVRFPSLATPINWLAASMAYVLADVVTGSSLFSTLLMDASNLTGVAIGYYIYMQYPRELRLLRRPMSTTTLIGVSVATAGVTSILGAGASTFISGGNYFPALAIWFSEEMVNYLAFMPFILTLPERWGFWSKGSRPSKPDTPSATGMNILIWMLFFGSCVLGVQVGGPGAIIFAVPALLWMSMTFSLFATACIVLAYVQWCQAAIMLGWVDVGIPLNDVTDVVSLRIGIALLALAPLTVGSINISRNKLLLELKKTVTYDSLTGILSRAAFLKKAKAELSRSAAVLLLLDIDHFKSVNDQFGHHVGDTALVTFCQAIKSELRERDLFGRLGGEEFAVLASNVPREEALQFAQRLCRKVEETSIVLADQKILRITVSIGVVTSQSQETRSLTDLLITADERLYKAKAGGRNRAVWEEGTS